MPRMGLACQLYTLRNLTQRDFAGTVAGVARVGYRAVELAGYGSLPGAREVRKVLDDHGMRAVASHTNVDALEQNLARVIDDNLALGSGTVVLSFLPEHRRRDLAGWKQSAELLSRVGAECRRSRLDFAYHHHHFEFQKFDGRYALDLLWENTDPAFLKAELDTFWIRYGGEDPAGYITKLGPRVTHLHLKDVIAGPPVRFGEVGTGILDFAEIVRAADAAGVGWGIVEQDETYGRPPLEAVKVSYDNLMKFGGWGA